MSYMFVTVLAKIPISYHNIRLTTIVVEIADILGRLHVQFATVQILSDFTLAFLNLCYYVQYAIFVEICCLKWSVC